MADENFIPTHRDDPRGTRSFHNYLREVFSKNKSETLQSILHIDVDRFLAYNDHFGHENGDKTLARIYKLICAASGHTVYRVSGEKFAIVLLDITAEEATKLAEKIRRAILDENIPSHLPNKGVIPLTVSIGVSVLPLSRFSCVEEMEMNAVLATFGAKANGRNCVFLATEILKTKPGR